MSKSIIFIYTIDLSIKQIELFHKYGTTLSIDITQPLSQLVFDYLLIDGNKTENLFYLLNTPKDILYSNYLILYSDKYIDTVPLFMYNIIYKFPKEQPTKMEFDQYLFQAYIKIQQKKRIYELKDNCRRWNNLLKT